MLIAVVSVLFKNVAVVLALATGISKSACFTSVSWSGYYKIICLILCVALSQSVHSFSIMIAATAAVAVLWWMTAAANAVIASIVAAAIAVNAAMAANVIIFLEVHWLL